jgi:hypothetical protein
VQASDVSVPNSAAVCVHTAACLLCLHKQQQTTTTKQQQNNESVKAAVTKIVEKYYNKK